MPLTHNICTHAWVHAHTHTHHISCRTDSHCDPGSSLPLQVEVQVSAIIHVGLNGNEDGALTAFTAKRLGEDQSVVLRVIGLQDQRDGEWTDDTGTQLASFPGF